MSILSSKNKILRTVHKDSITTLTSRLDFFLSWIWKTLPDNIISFFETEEMETWTAKDLVRYQFILDLDQTLCVSVHCPSHFFQLTEKCVLSITVNRCINVAFKIMFCLFFPPLDMNIHVLSLYSMFYASQLNTSLLSLLTFM